MVQLDLEEIFTDERFSDFRLLWLVCHESRVEAERPEECWLERWFELARLEGVRALDKLRVGVEDALRALGTGFSAIQRTAPFAIGLHAVSSPPRTTTASSCASCIG